MKKFVILILICVILTIFCSCSADTSGYSNELVHNSWSAELDGGGSINLKFNGDKATVSLKSGNDKTELCGTYAVDDTTLVLFVPKLCQNYRFEYTPHGKKLDLSFNGSKITLNRDDNAQKTE